MAHQAPSLVPLPQQATLIPTSRVLTPSPTSHTSSSVGPKRHSTILSLIQETIIPRGSAAVPSNTCYTAPPVHPAMGVQLQPIAPVSQDVAAMGLPGSRQELVLQSHVDPSSNCKQVTTAEK